MTLGLELPNDYAVYLRRARVHERVETYGEASPLLEAVAAVPLSDEVQLQLRQYWLARGDLELAERHLRRALDINAHNTGSGVVVEGSAVEIRQ